jgi:hypothetical protein
VLFCCISNRQQRTPSRAHKAHFPTEWIPSVARLLLLLLFLPAISGTSHCLVFVPLINTVLLLGAPVLPTRWVKISTYLQSEPFLSITFILINLKLLIIFVHTPNVLCYVVLSYHVLVATPHLSLFVYFLY